MAPVLAYWNVRGLAEHIRMLLHYLGVKYEDKAYDLREEWFAEKFKLGMDFPNLPYYIDGDFKVTQSSAIIEYIADSHNMLPTCKEHRAMLHMVYNDIKDFRSSVGKIIYYQHTDDDTKQFLKGLPDKLNQYEKYLGEKQWLSGDEINYPDFSLCELLIQLERFDPSSLKGFPELKAYLKRFKDLPQLKDYLASSKFKDRK
ncbi:hypothetical protein Aperf_G00000056455 [Anoplocephala perfoliata]